MREIREAADMAETFPGSGVLNWGEMNMQAFCDWVAQVAPQDVGTDHPVGVFDVESVQGMFDCWWRDGVCKARKPAIAEAHGRRSRTVQPLVGGSELKGEQ